MELPTTSDLQYNVEKYAREGPIFMEGNGQSAKSSIRIHPCLNKYNMDVHQLVLCKDKDVERQGIAVTGATDLYEDPQYW